MAIVKRLSIAVLALAFVVTLTTQTLVFAQAMPIPPIAMPSSAAGMSAHPDGPPAAPCKQATPICAEHVGCVTAVAIPASPAGTGVPIQWRKVSYNPAVSHLTGRSIEPEPYPPILAA